MEAKCLRCRKHRKVYSRNLCKSCYGTIRSQGNLDAYQKIRVLVEECRDCGISRGEASRFELRDTCVACYDYRKTRSKPRPGGMSLYTKKPERCKECGKSLKGIRAVQAHCNACYRRGLKSGKIMRVKDKAKMADWRRS